MFAKHWIKLTVMTLFGLAIIVASCSEDTIRPVIVDIGGTMEVTHISPADGEAILIDGNPGGPDIIWEQAKEFLIVVQDSISRKGYSGYISIVRLKALTDSTYFYLLATWEDPSKDVRPDFWIRSGNWLPRVWGQDFFCAIFDSTSDTLGASCANMCHRDSAGFPVEMYNPGPGMVDTWCWHSGTTNPTRTLQDKHMMAEDFVSYDATFLGQAVYTRNFLSEVNPIPVWMHETDTAFTGDFLYYDEAVDMDLTIYWRDSLMIPGYVVSRQVNASGAESLYEIEAEGHYDEGEQVWTLEIKRKLDTGHDDDIPFVLGERINCTIGVTDNPRDNSPHEHYGSDPFIIQF
jgi:hypothetical protein